MNYDQEEFNSYFRLFELGSFTPEGCSDWLLFRNPESARLLHEKAASLGGQISVSHFEIAFDLLRNSGEIKQLRQPKPAEEFTLTAAEYRTLPASQVVRRYRQDPEFKHAVDALVASGAI